MIEIVMYSLILMLSGILIYEVSKFLWNSLSEYRIKRECDRYESKEFEKDMQKSFKKLGIAYQKRLNCNPSNVSREKTVRVHTPYK
jgi:hypothetical protein